MTEDKRAILEGLGVVPPQHEPRPARPTLSPKETIDVMRESRDRHGTGRDADRAHLHEMLRRNDLPPFVRVQLQRAHNRHLMRDRMEAYGKGKPTT